MMLPQHSMKTDRPTPLNNKIRVIIISINLSTQSLPGVLPYSLVGEEGNVSDAKVAKASLGKGQMQHGVIHTPNRARLETWHLW